MKQYEHLTQTIKNTGVHYIETESENSDLITVNLPEKINISSDRNRGKGSQSKQDSNRSGTSSSDASQRKTNKSKEEKKLRGRPKMKKIFEGNIFQKQTIIDSEYMKRKNDINKEDLEQFI